MDEQIQVSVLCWVYNHEKYLRQCLDGFVMQKDVSFEIIIHDDASTDNSANIIREYEKKYPNLFKPIYQTENQYSKKVNIAQKFMVPLIAGKYVALCEGDDYWTDPYKLKKQFNALEENPDCFFCLHKVKRVYQDGSSADKLIPWGDLTTRKMTSDQFYGSYEKTDYYHTSSYFVLGIKYKNYILYPPVFKRVAPVGDVPMLMYFSYIGNVYYIDDVMSVYRFLSDGSWSSGFFSYDKESIIKRENHYNKLKSMMDEFFVFSKGKYRKELLFMTNRIDKMIAATRNDKYWLYINNKDYAQLFKDFSIKELKELGLSKKALFKMKLQAHFPWLFG